MSDKRLIEEEFPLHQTSLDSVHEKNVRHGHLSTLHIWPARRPLAASRAVAIATLLPCPEDPEERHKLVQRIGGTVTQKIKKEVKNGRTVQSIKEETEGSITRWTGTPPKNGKKAILAHKALTEHREAELEFFREEIRKAYGGRAPRVLDPFAGGGAIPLEAMRLGCETFAMDINPVACFILRATLEYPQKLAGKTCPLPDFSLKNKVFMKDFLSAHPQYAPMKQGSLLKGKRTPVQSSLCDTKASKQEGQPVADLAWQVRAWGQHVLEEARKELGRFYPTYAEFEPWSMEHAHPYEKQQPKLVPLTAEGVPDMHALNGDFSDEYIKDEGNARWVEKPTVAYLWARTCRCSSCRAETPLLKTKWLCKKDGKRVLLTVTPKEDKSGVVFGVQENVPVVGGNNKQRKAHDAQIGKGFMSRTGVTCPCCGATMTMDDIKIEGKAGRIGLVPTAVVYEQTNVKGKRYRLYTQEEMACARDAVDFLEETFSDLPYGIPTEPTPVGGSSGAGRAFSVYGYGMTRWCDLFTPRQLLALGVLCKAVRKAMIECLDKGYPQEWAEAIGVYLACSIDKLADYNSSLCTWINSAEKIGHTFSLYSLRISWDFCEQNPFSSSSGNFLSCIELISEYINTEMHDLINKNIKIIQQSCIIELPKLIDCIITDPPYYDIIPYSDCMDFFYVWLKRSTSNSILDNGNFSFNLGPKWDNSKHDGELIDDASRHKGDSIASKKAYEDGMSEVFKNCYSSLNDDGRLIIVFANKQSEAWETLVTAIIRAGFVVTASWPIQTERTGRSRAMGSAALSTSVWLVCKKRGFARPGWDNKVLENMRSNITRSLRNFWDDGVRGPDFVWAATGPALAAYSAYPVVKKADASGVLTVSEFLSEVRRLVVEFVVGRVLSGEHGQETEASGLDPVTSYYLLHRNDFGLGDAPAGACILYATACNSSDNELVSVWNLLKVSKKTKTVSDEDEFEDTEDASDASEESEDSGGKYRLLKWNERHHATLGTEGRNGRPVPLIDRIHKLMQLWNAGEQSKVDEFLDSFALRRNELFLHVIQSLIELSENEERSLLESISNHIQSRGIQPQRTLQQGSMLK